MGPKTVDHNYSIKCLTGYNRSKNSKKVFPPEMTNRNGHVNWDLDS